MNLTAPNWTDGSKPLPVENVLVQEHEYEGRVYPWYMLPFRWPTAASGVINDPFSEHRKLFDVLRDYADVFTPSAIEELSWQLGVENPNHFIHKHLRVRDKEAQIVPFDHHNLLQRRLWWAFSIQWYNGLPVRIDVLKGRQMGASTYAEGLESALFFTRENQYALLMSNKDTNSTAIFRMVERYYDALEETLPAHRIPLISQHSALKLDLGTKRRTHQAHDGEKEGKKGPILRNLLEVKTASATAPDLGLTPSLGHFTEMCKWPSPEETWEALSQGIPDVPGTVIIRESTAWAFGDWWHECVKTAAAGEGKFLFVFNGPQDAEWRWSHRNQRWVREYSEELPSQFRRFKHPEDAPKLRASYFKTLPKELKKQAAENSLTMEQCEWARQVWIDKCTRSWDAFFRQYPFSWPQAFRSSGHSFFSPEACEHYLNTTSDGAAPLPVWQGNFELTSEGIVELFARQGGYTNVYVPPIPGGEYVIGVDGAEGDDPDGDFSVASVWDAKHNVQCAQVVMRLEQVEYFSAQVQALARYYNDAFVVPECTGSAGYAITKNLQPSGQYPVENLYVRESFDSVGRQTILKWGYTVAGKLKLQLIAGLREVINAMVADVRSPLSARQYAGYIRRADGTYGNSRRKVGYDDCVIADALAFAGINCEQRLGTASNKASAVAAVLPGLPQDGRFRELSIPLDQPGTSEFVHPELGSCV